MANHIPLPTDLLHLIEKRDRPDRRKGKTAAAAPPRGERRKQSRRKADKK